jgi:hypothetical protein
MRPCVELIDVKEQISAWGWALGLRIDIEVLSDREEKRFIHSFIHSFIHWMD